MTAIKPIPRKYRGVRFRSTLEADWAATFDSLGWYWQYEPQGLVIDENVPYLCDFYLPTQRVWCEVKGPHDERLDKPGRLATALGEDPWDIKTPLVVILRAPGPGDCCTWEGTRGTSQDLQLFTCGNCQHHGFVDLMGLWGCRRCFELGKVWYGKGGAGPYAASEVGFVRARDFDPGAG